MTFCCVKYVDRGNPSVDDPIESVDVIVRPMGRGHTRSSEQKVSRKRTGRVGGDKKRKKGRWTSESNKLLKIHKGLTGSYDGMRFKETA